MRLSRLQSSQRPEKDKHYLSKLEVQSELLPKQNDRLPAARTVTHGSSAMLEHPSLAYKPRSLTDFSVKRED